MPYGYCFHIPLEGHKNTKIMARRRQDRDKRSQALPELPPCPGCGLPRSESKPPSGDFCLPDTELEEKFDEVVVTEGQFNSFNKPAGDLWYGAFAEGVSDHQFKKMPAGTGPADGTVLSRPRGQDTKKGAPL